MGDMADQCLDEMFDPEYYYDESDELQYEDRIWFPKPVTCSICGKGGLRWGQVANNWKLHGATGIHMCKPAISINTELICLKQENVALS